MQKFRDATFFVKFTMVSGTFIVLAFVFFAIFAEIVSPYDPLRITSLTYAPPGTEGHILGTDMLGRDILSRIIYGSRISLYIVIISTLLSSVTGSSLGFVSGYMGGAVDRILTMFMDALYGFPAFVLSITIGVMMGPPLTPEKLAIAVMVGWIPMYYRMMRSLSISVKQQDFIRAERMMGAGVIYIIAKHIVPYAVPTFLVLAFMNISRSLLYIGGLGFLGVGVPAPTPEWGPDLSL